MAKNLSRTSLWRRSQGKELCPCEYHQEDTSNLSECDCEYHTICGCMFHASEQNQVHGFEENPSGVQIEDRSDVSDCHDDSMICDTQVHGFEENPSGVQIEDRSDVSDCHDDSMICDTQVHGFEENPGGVQIEDRSDNVSDRHDDPGDPGDYDDPEDDDPGDDDPGDDDPGDSDDYEDHGDSDDSDEPDEPQEDIDDSDSDPDADMGHNARNFNLDNGRLNRVLQAVVGRTEKEVMAMVIALAVRSNMDYETIIKIFSILHMTMDQSLLPRTKEQMWSCLNRSENGIRKHVYCSRCFKNLGMFQRLRSPVQCICGWTKPKSKVKYFITLNVRSQLENILNQIGMWDLLQYPQTRQKYAPDSIEDIFDGDAYKNLRQNQQMTPYDFTYTFNLDGFKISGSSKTEAWPIYMRLNELPPNRRQQNVILAAVWVDKEYVDFNLFMKVFVKQANKLSSTGVTWKPNGVDEVVSRFFPTVCTCDAKGRCGVLNMASYSGFYGCTFCEHVGIKLEGSMKFPIPGTIVNRIRRHQGIDYIEQVEIQPAPLRTDESIRNLMLEVAAGPNMQRVRGVKGPAQVMLLRFFDLANGFSTDDLHPIFQGVTEFHTELLLEGIPGVYSVTKREIAVINSRLQEILTPTHLSRKPRGIDLIKMWKASEFRNWLLYYAIPCLQGIIPNRYLRVFALLVKAIFLLCRDIITNGDLVEADRCLHEYVRQFQDIYGPQSIRFNIHVLLHVVPCVRSWGNFFSHSTFNFESLNHRLGKTVSSPRGAADQIVMRFLMHRLVNHISQNPDISDEVKEHIERDIVKKQLNDVETVNGAHFFGKSILRNVTAVERRLLLELGYDVNVVTEYFQVKLKGLECRSLQYAQDLMSCNSYIYTTDDDFGVVESIVVIGGNHQTAGVFVRLYVVGDPLQGVPHIVPILEEEVLSYLPISDIRNVAVKMCVLRQWYIAPMANQHDID